MQIIPIRSASQFLVLSTRPVFSGRKYVIVDTIEHAISIRRDFQ